MEVGSQGEEVGQRIQLVFAFEYRGVVVFRVDGVFLSVGRRLEAAGRRGLEGVAVGRLDNELDLGVDRAQDETVQVLVLVRQELVAGYLIRGIAQPFRVDIPGHDERLGTLPLGILPLVGV